MAAVGNPSDFIASLESGDLIGLALMDTERGNSRSDEGHSDDGRTRLPDAVFGTFRGWFAAGEIDPEVMEILRVPSRR